MTLQELRFILALSRDKHFRKAADNCFVSQPTLSIAIRKLEEELNIALFERNKNEVHITPVGMQIIERAKRILADVSEIKQIAESARNPLIGPLKLGAIYTVAPYLLPSLIISLNKLAPNMPIEIQEDYTVNLREKLLTGELDAILISLPFTENGIRIKNLYKEPFVVLMPKNHPLAKYKNISEKALSDHPILMLGEGHCFRDQVISSCPLCFSGKKASILGGSLETIRHMVASGMGLTILPKTAAQIKLDYDSLLTTRPLKAASPHRTVALAWRKSFPRSMAIDTLIEAFDVSAFFSTVK